MLVFIVAINGYVVLVQYFSNTSWMRFIRMKQSVKVFCFAQHIINVVVTGRMTNELNNIEVSEKDRENETKHA